jgi:hypothetical protein
LLLAGALLFVVAAFSALRAARQLRGAAYYAVRQDALSRTRWWAFVATIALLATSGLAIYLSSLPAPTAVANTPTTTPTPMVVDVPSRMLPTATFAPSPTPAPSSTPVPVLTATATSLPAATLPPNVPAILQTPLPSSAPVSPNAQLRFTTLASLVDSKGTPADPGLVFPGGTRRVRLFFQAAKVNNGAMWSVLCYKGDQLVDSVIELWKWGARTQNARAFCSIDGSPGDYTLAAYLGPNKQFDVAFQLQAATPPPTNVP